MSIIINSDIETLYETFTSRNFISKIFSIDNKENIKKKQNGKHMVFQRVYTSKDIQEENEIKLPENFANVLGNKAMENINITFETTHNVIHRDDKSFVVKYMSILKKPEYIYSITGDCEIMIYACLSKNPKDDNLIVVNIFKKFVNLHEECDDTPYISFLSNDVFSNVFEQNKGVFIPENIVKLSEAIFGTTMFNEIVLPFVNNLFDVSLETIHDVYVSRLIKYFSRKNIEIYKKK